MKKSIASVFLIFTFFMVMLSGCVPASTPVHLTDSFTPIPRTSTPVHITDTLTPIPRTSTPAQNTTPTPTGSNLLSDVDPSSILFEQDFNNGRRDGVTLYQPNWQMEGENGNKYLCSIPGDYYAGLNFGQNSWTNYAVELHFMEVEHQIGITSTVGIYFRYDSSTNRGNAGLLDLDGHIASLLLNEPAEDVSITSYQTVSNTWHTMRIEVAGQKVYFYINNQLVGSGKDSTFQYGAANFSVSPYEKICVDDIRVWALNENGQIIRAATPDPTMVATLENNPNDIYPQVWAQISPTGQSYEYKVNCGGVYSKLETCFLWNIDQVIVTSPSEKNFSLHKDFNTNNYSGEITRRWVLYGPDKAGLPENGEYLFSYYRNGQIVHTQIISFSQEIFSIPTNVSVSQQGNDLHVTWQPPTGITFNMTYKVIIFVKSNGQLATSLSFPYSSTEAILTDPPLTPGVDYFLNVALFWPTGFAYSVNIPFKWSSP